VLHDKGTVTIYISYTQRVVQRHVINENVTVQSTKTFQQTRNKYNSAIPELYTL